MKKLKISEGIKASLGDLINKAQNISLDNQSELAVQLFSPGFFVKKTINGALEDDWKPSIVDNELKIATKGRKPAYCYTAGGKILSLKESSNLDPKDIDGYTYYNSTGTVNTNNVVYELWVVPNINESEPVDYLPNYKMTGETKYLVDNYLAGFLLIKKGAAPPTIIYNLDSTLPPTSITKGNRQIFNTVEGLKVAEFTYKESTNTITNLIDFRLENRAYLKQELYDFFNEAYLKHDYLLMHAEDSADNNVLSFKKNGINPPTLSGVFTLVSVKEKITTGLLTYPSKIKIAVNSLPVPVNSVLAITVTSADYVSASNLVKTLEVIPLDQYTPNVDKILIGYHLRTKLDGGVANEEDSGGSTEVLPNLDGTENIPKVNSELSVIYFVNGLPPLPPGQNISRNGIGSYILTKDEAAVAYYNKTKSDSRFFKTGNDSLGGYEQITYKNDAYHSVDGSARTGEAYNGVKFENEDIPVGLYAGYAWLNHENNTLGYMHRGVSSGDNAYIELGVFKNDGTGLRAFRIENGFMKTIGSNEYPGNTESDGNKLVTVAYGLLNRGDDAKGNYNWKLGKFLFYQPSEEFDSNLSQTINPENLAESSTIKVLQFNFDSINPVVMDLLDHRITGSLDPREGAEGEKDLIPRKFLDNKITVINNSIEGLQNKIPLLSEDGEYHYNSKHGILLNPNDNGDWIKYMEHQPSDFVYMNGIGWYMINITLKINSHSFGEVDQTYLHLDILKYPGNLSVYNNDYSLFKLWSENLTTSTFENYYHHPIFTTSSISTVETLVDTFKISKIAYLNASTDLTSDRLYIFLKRESNSVSVSPLPSTIECSLFMEIIKITSLTNGMTE
jgi:hypothetical protein